MNKKEIAEKIFGVRRLTLHRWATTGPPANKLDKIDNALLRHEQKIGIKEGGTAFARRVALSSPDLLKVRLNKNFGDLWEVKHVKD